MSVQNSPPNHPGALVETNAREGTLHITLHGQLDAPGIATIWDDAVTPVLKGSFGSVIVDCTNITYMDGSGIALLLKLKEATKLRNGDIILTNLHPDYQQLVDMTWETELPRWRRDQNERRGLTVFIGKSVGDILNGLYEMIAFVGEATAMVFGAIRHPSRVRLKDVLLSCIVVGVDSLFIITLIGFLMGLIMSFQSAVSLQQFGGEIFVPNMLGLVMFREMGPLVTAILLAARSGSAFAAEIGTMKINEELDALTTMGLSPMQFMVLPKLLSAILMVPLMTLFFNLASLVGGAVVMLSLCFPLVTFTSRVFAYLDYLDFWGGMIKCMVFAVLVAGVGCLRGMQTQTGASAVGLSTTSAVVSGIILIAFADGLFAVAFYYLGW